jgi:hypothetical protein
MNSRYTWHAHAGLEAHYTRPGLVGLHGASRRASFSMGMRLAWAAGGK